jgi:pimeloyl-ACP methyl ester carboxylesterase
MRRHAFWPRSLGVAAREAVSLARQAWLLPHDLLTPVLPQDCEPGDDVVVLLHGLFASAGVLRPLGTTMSQHMGVHTATMSYPPGPGVDELSTRLRHLLDTLPPKVRLHLVGHSLGGIILRYLAQQGTEPRIVQTISLASPFAGVPRAAWLGLSGTKDLDEDSPLLRALRLDAASCEIPHLSIIAGSDHLVRSPIAHALPGSEVIVLEGRGHNTLLFDHEVAQLVTKRILGRR